MIRLKLSLLFSLVLFTFFLANEIILSDIQINIAPNKKPMVATKYAGILDVSSARSIAG